MVRISGIDNLCSTTFGSLNSHSVLNLSEVSDILAFCSDVEDIGSFFRDHSIIQSPVFEGITHSRSSNQGSFSTFEVVGSASHSTTFNRVSNHRDSVHRDDGLGKVSNERHILSHIEGVDSFGRNFSTIDSPVEEVIAIVRSSCHSNLITIVVRSISDGYFTAFTSNHSDLIVDHLEVSDKFSITSHSEDIFSIRADDFVIEHPVHEIPSFVRSGNDGHFRAEIGIAVKDVGITAFCGIDFHTN